MGAEAGNYALDVFNSTKDTVTGVAGGLFGGAKGIADQTMQGWQNTKEQVGVPEWMQKVLRIHEEIGERPGGEGGGGPGGEPPKESRYGTAAAAGATVAAYGYDQSSEEDPRSGEESARDDQMMVLTKKMELLIMVLIQK